jgi:hypothetical protein
MAAGVFRAVAAVAALLASVQPVLGSLALVRGGEFDYEQLHLVAGGLLYVLAIVLAVIAPFTGFRRRWTFIGLCLVLYGLTHIQLRLGLGSNDDASLLAYHIPLGVLIVLVAYLTLGLSFGLRLDSERAWAGAPPPGTEHQGGTDESLSSSSG